MEAEISTKHLRGTSDLTLLADIKPGLISSLDTRTYLTRLRVVLRTLHMLRVTAREYSFVRPFSDSTDRIRTITDLRIAIHEDENRPRLMLSVTFDRPWEPYLRTIWRDVGKQLDLIFSNCADYPISTLSSFETYGKWIRDARTNTQFFYKPSALTFDDELYLRQTEKDLHDLGADDLRAATKRLKSPGDIASTIINNPAFLTYTIKAGMQALSIIYRLADFYRPLTPDGDILLRAAGELLRELPDGLHKLDGAATADPKFKAIKDGIGIRFEAQLAWFRSVPTPPTIPPTSPPMTTNDAQGCVLTGYKEITDSCLVLLRINDPKTSGALLKELRELIYTNKDAIEGKTPAVYVNMAFTPQGLRALGLTNTDMAALPSDFLEGMEERAGLIGDVRGNHPRNWKLPPLWLSGGGCDQSKRVEMSSVHIVLQLSYKDDQNFKATLSSKVGPKSFEGKGADLLPLLRAWVANNLARINSPVQVLAIEPMRRYMKTLPDGSKKPVEHFGFVDSLSQPQIGLPLGGPAWDNLADTGEFLLGHQNDRKDPPKRDPLTDNGSFMVIRKLRQDVKALEVTINAPGAASDALKAWMVGRTIDGDPLAVPGSGNAFDYGRDTDGLKCPFAAHIRRSNPRSDYEQEHDTPSVPRMVRRGMPYGPLYDREHSDPDPAKDKERGLMFICYNASISEQFEVIQRWIASGNSTDVLSEHSDPLLGVPQVAEPRVFRYVDSSVQRVTLSPLPYVTLEWGMYAFLPSISGLDRIIERAILYSPPPYERPLNMPPDTGAQILKRLIARDRAAVSGSEIEEAIRAWKAAIEDGHARSSGEAEALWKAIRLKHGGVLRTHYGVLVASRTLVEEVLENTGNDFSSSGYALPQKLSSGETYLSLDDGTGYQRLSAVTNAAIMAVPQASALALAKVAADAFLQRLVQGTKAIAAALGQRSWETTLDVKEISDAALAIMCEQWFNLNDFAGAHMRPGGSPWNWATGQPPLYPAHFTAPSRYVFQPNPRDQQIALGQARGQALLTAITNLVDAYRTAGTQPAGLIAQAIFNDPNLAPVGPATNDLVARTLLGALIGFVPTVEGNFLSIMNEWLNERVLWELRDAHAAGSPSDVLDRLERTMMYRPVPEYIWRTAVNNCWLGGVAVKRNDKIVASTVAATHEDLFSGKVDVSPVFGGNRRAAANPPRHACPGYDMGLGVLLGMLSAVVELNVVVRPTPAPLTLSLSGPT